MYQEAKQENSLNPKLSKNKFWFALYTKPRHEFKALEFLRNIEEVEPYLPTITTLKQWSDRKKKVTEPLFKSYIFVHCNEFDRFKTLQDSSVVTTVTFEGKPAKIPAWQIENLQRLLAEKREIFVQDIVKVGTKVKITDGPFKDITGIVCQSDDKGEMLGITIDLLRRSVLVKLPADSIVKEINQEENESETSN